MGEGHIKKKKKATGWVKLYRSRRAEQGTSVSSCPECRSASVALKILFQMPSDYLHHNHITAQIKNQYVFFTIWE